MRKRSQKHFKQRNETQSYHGPRRLFLYFAIAFHPTSSRTFSPSQHVDQMPSRGSEMDHFFVLMWKLHPQYLLMAESIELTQTHGSTYVHVELIWTLSAYLKQEGGETLRPKTWKVKKVIQTLYIRHWYMVQNHICSLNCSYQRFPVEIFHRVCV